uniref:hypothetical protein n=1 Tax=Thauera sp. SDU_THAU2 TaxID=3136633 RepID=UPI00311FD73B
MVYTDSRFPEGGIEHLRHLEILGRQNVLAKLHERDADAECVHHIGELAADGAGPQHDQLFRQAIQGQHARRRQDELFVEREARQQQRPRSGRDDDVPGRYAIPTPFRPGQGKLADAGDRPRSLDDLDFVLAQQRRYATGQRPSRTPRAGVHLAVAKPAAVDADAEGFHLPQRAEFGSVVDQAFRRDASPVQTDAARRILFDDAGRKT